MVNRQWRSPGLSILAVLDKLLAKRGTLKSRERTSRDLTTWHQIAGLDIARLDNARPYRKGGHRETCQCGIRSNRGVRARLNRGGPEQVFQKVQQLVAQCATADFEKASAAGF